MDAPGRASFGRGAALAASVTVVRLVLAVVLVAASLAAGCTLRRTAEPPPSPYCRAGDPLAGVYHPSRLSIKRRCAVAVGVVERVKFEEYDGDVHIDVRVDEEYRHLLSRGNDQVDGNLVVEIIPQDRSRVAIPEIGARVTIVGPWVDDETHDWNEIHPAWWISSGRIVEATPSELRRVQALLRGDHVAGYAEEEELEAEE